MTASSIIESLRETWIPVIYREKVRGQRTRSYEMEIPERENSAEILFTLLGIELKVGKRRFACPDLATARYLLVFARLGCGNVAIPYDITRISVIADELEMAWQRLVLTVTDATKRTTPSARGRMRSAVIRAIREEVNAAGAGPQMPEFKNSTRQRNY